MDGLIRPILLASINMLGSCQHIEHGCDERLRSIITPEVEVHHPPFPCTVTVTYDLDSQAAPVNVVGTTPEPRCAVWVDPAVNAIQTAEFLPGTAVAGCAQTFTLLLDDAQ